MRRENYHIASKEWFVPVGWKRGNIGKIFDEIESAKNDSAMLLQKVVALKDEIVDDLMKERI